MFTIENIAATPPKTKDAINNLGLFERDPLSLININ